MADKQKKKHYNPDHEAIHILIADDNDVNRKLVTLLLEDSGFRISGVANGQDAVDALKANDYDIVLMDLEMPVVDGISAARIIRNPSSGVLKSDIPIIAMTAYSLDEDRQRCMEAGMNDFVTKPILSADLIEVVKTNLNL